MFGLVNVRVRFGFLKKTKLPERKFLFSDGRLNCLDETHPTNNLQ